MGRACGCAHRNGLTMKKGKSGPRELPTTVTYLAMDARPIGAPPPPPLLKTALFRCENPPVHFYRYLYNQIGQPHFWVERRIMADDALHTLLHAPSLQLYVLYIGGVPGGMAELDFKEEGTGQISYFGLTPEFTGRRIGPWFLHKIIELCWGQPIKRLLVNTCTLDHKKALATYQRAGFTAYARAERFIPIPADFPGL